MLEIGHNEFGVNQVSCTIPIKMTLHNCLEFIEGFMAAIPLYFHADHWDLFGLQGESIYIRVLKSVVRANVCGGITICWSKWKGCLVKVM